MTVVQAIAGHKMLAVVGKLGLPNGCGAMTCAVTKLGDDFEDAGIFRRNGRHKNQKIVKMKHYVPTNPQTTAQQTRRATFANGVIAWKTLPTLEKNDYRQRAKGQKMSGFNLHQREYMSSH